VCCDDDLDFTEWTPYDLRIGVLPGPGQQDPTYTLSEGSYSVYKVIGKSLFIKFGLLINATSPGVGIYCFSIPPGFSGFDTVGNGLILLIPNGVDVQLLYLSEVNSIKVVLPTNNTVGTITTSTIWDTFVFPLSIVELTTFIGDIHIRLA
jgi:hypothetical protein